MVHITIFIPIFYRVGNSGSERGWKLSKVTQLVRDRSRTQI